MLSKILSNCKNQWKDAVEDKNHPFKYFVLSTVNHRNKINSRKVVLRKFNPEDLCFSIFTDFRSKKVNDLQSSKSVQLLFYNPEDAIQIIVNAILINKNTDIKIFNKLSEHSKKNYTTLYSPGTIIENPYNLKYGNKINFCELSFKAVSFETLSLKKELNIRTFFELKNSWKGIFLVP
tara:strand:+ start:867 stop:1400 length:534 start_codon:yes stop_codon:yes gene_type:complete